jgi:uncharacterized protein (TIGR00369 family)
MKHGAGAVMSVEEVDSYLQTIFPQIYEGGRQMVVERVGVLSSCLRLKVDQRHLRPGGTVSGPAMFMLADVALYVAVLANIGPKALAVTTNIGMNFLRRPESRDLIADCRLMKLGARLAVGEVDIRTEGEDDLVAHVTGTYSLPPR